MPYRRLAGFYLFYFAALGVLVPYWGLYLQSVGFNPAEIGTLLALLMLSRIVAPVLWGWIADHRGRHMTVVRLASLGALVCFAGVFLGTRFWWLAAVLLLFSFFWHAALPLLEVFTLRHTAERPGAYGRVRLWGSIGFIAAVMGLGPVVDAFGPWWVLPAMSALLAGIWLATLALPESGLDAPIEHPEPFHRVILRPEVAGFLLACFLMQLGHGPYYTFYTIYLEAHGYSKTLIGSLWAFAVLCEIGLFLLMPALLARVALHRVLLASFLLAALRWLLIGGFPDSLAVLVLAQTLHAATFGAFHGSAIQLVHRFFTGRHQHRGQAIYGSASFGLGGAVGSFYSGHTWTLLGPAATFALAAGAALAAFAVGWVLLRPRT